jgi:Zn-dependent peptidase ImmA (M78 family)
MHAQISIQRAKAAGSMAAMEILAEHWDGGLPVQPQWIARVLGVEVASDDLDPDVSGRIEGQEGFARVYLNRSDHELRQRFTLAHELGHFIENKDRDFEYIEYRDPVAAQGDKEEEVFANSFAAELLMPKTAIETLLQSGMEERQMARELTVSVSAMVTRLRSLGWYPLKV